VRLHSLLMGDVTYAVAASSSALPPESLMESNRRRNSERPDGISLVLPAFNEALRIRGTIESYIPTLTRTGLPYEIIVVSDGTDNTPGVVRSMDTGVAKVLQFDRRLGKGGAVVEGFKVARFGRVGFTDADGSLHPESLSSLIELASRFDCVFGSRWVPGSRWLVRESKTKEVAGRIFNVLVRVALRIGIRDTQCGAKFYSAPFLDRLLPTVYVNNETSDVSFIFHAIRLGGRVIEAPVIWTNRASSRFKLVRMSFHSFFTVLGMKIANSRAGRLLPSNALWTIRDLMENL
jgi:glycosyltransferase involved in cell wall biosynthesis